MLSKDELPVLTNHGVLWVQEVLVVAERLDNWSPIWEDANWLPYEYTPKPEPPGEPELLYNSYEPMPEDKL
jgi:hypothetical protein